MRLYLVERGREICITRLDLPNVSEEKLISVICIDAVKLDVVRNLDRNTLSPINMNLRSVRRKNIRQCTLRHIFKTMYFCELDCFQVFDFVIGESKAGFL